MNTSQLDDFISKTEGESVVVSSDLEYPFAYIDSVTNVELRSWVNSRVLHNNKTSDLDMPLALAKDDKFLKLAYITLCPSTFKQLSYLKDRHIKVKLDESTEEFLEDRIAMIFLLGD